MLEIIRQYVSIVKAVIEKAINDVVVNWIGTLLKIGITTAELGVHYTSIGPKVAVFTIAFTMLLSSGLAAYRLNDSCYSARCYADVIVTDGRCPNLTQNWYKQELLSVNPVNTVLVPFTVLFQFTVLFAFYKTEKTFQFQP